MSYLGKQRKRCHWYENDGSPRLNKGGTKGCMHRACYFIHPDHPEWSVAIKTRPDRPERDSSRDRDRDRDRDRYRGSREFGERERDRGRDESKNRDPEREGAQSSRAPSSGPSTAPSPTKDPRLSRPAHSTSSSFSTAPPPTTTSSNSIPLGVSPKRSPSTSTLPSRDRSRDITATTSTTVANSLARSDTLLSPNTHTRQSSYSSFERNSFRDRDRSPASATSDSRSRLDSNRIRRDSAASVTVPTSPAPPHSAPPHTTNLMPPPPILKTSSLQPLTAASPNATSSTSPSSATNQATTVAKAPARQDKIQIWADRIKQLSDAVQVRTQHVAIEQELSQLKSLLASRKYVNLSDVVKEKLEKQVKVAEDRHAEKRLELNDIVYKLVDSEFWDASLTWPGVDENAAQADSKGKGKDVEPGWGGRESRESKAEERFGELRAVVWQVRSGVADLYKIVGELQGYTGTEGSRPPKRPRLDESMVDAVSTILNHSPSTSTLTSTTHSFATTVPSPAPPVELDSINDRLTAIDDRVSDLENTMVQFDSETLNELEHRMQERFHAFNLMEGDERMEIDGEPDNSGQHEQRKQTVTQRMQHVEKEIDRAGQDISGLAIEIAEIITRAQASDDEVAKLKQENAEMRDRIVTLEKQNQENSENLEAVKAEMEALNMALQAFIGRPASPPPVLSSTPSQPLQDPFLPDLDLIIDTVGPRIIHSVRENIVPMLEELKSSVEAMATEHNAQIAQNVMNKLQITLKTVDVIYTWMNRTAAAAQMPPPPVAAPLGQMARSVAISHIANNTSNIPNVGTPLGSGTSANIGATPIMTGLSPQIMSAKAVSQ